MQGLIGLLLLGVLTLLLWLIAKVKGLEERMQEMKSLLQASPTPKDIDPPPPPPPPPGPK